MAEHFIALIPADPRAELPGNADALRMELEALAGGGESRVKDYGKLQFIDCGQNLRRIGCPACGGAIPLEVWQGWMEADWHAEDGFHLHRHAAPCCGAGVTLNELAYDAPQGFARWFVGARSTGGTLTDPERGRLEAVAGLALKAVHQSY